MSALVAFAISIDVAPVITQTVHLDQVRSIRCETRSSVTTTWDHGVPMARVTATPALTPMTFDAIIRVAGRARLIGNAGAADVSVQTGDNGLQFVERTASGNLMVTTVYRAPTRVVRSV
ncbi:MAG: hypothetical protein V4813_08760 [Gemmatimonadota bacterium]